MTPVTTTRRSYSRYFQPWRNTEGPQPPISTGGCADRGPFHLVDKGRFVQLLRAMIAGDLIFQNSEGLLLHGEVGERHVNHYAFYAAFASAEEWRLTVKGRNLGTIPLDQPIHQGMRLIFGGKRWLVNSVDSSTKVVDVEPSTGGNPPVFSGSPALVSDRVRTEMVEVYKGTDVPRWLDSTARDLLAEGRDTFTRYRLERESVVAEGDAVFLFPWVGDRALFTLSMMLREVGFACDVEGPSVMVTNAGRGSILSTLGDILRQPPPEAQQLTKFIENREIDKWDWVLTEDLAEESAGARLLDIPKAWSAVEEMLGRLQVG